MVKGLISYFSNFYPMVLFQKLMKKVSSPLFYPKRSLFLSLSIVFLFLILGESIYWIDRMIDHLVNYASLTVGYPIFIGIYIDHMMDSHLWTVWLWNSSIILFLLSVAIRLLEKTNWLSFLRDVVGNKIMVAWALFFTGATLNIVSLFL